MIRNILLVLGLLFAAATQLRISGLPLGPGEMCLAAWVGLSVARNSFRLHAPFSPAFLQLFTFWVMMFVGLSIGLMTAYVIGEIHHSYYFRHDVMAYALLASLSLLLLMEPNAGQRLRDIAWVLVVIGSGMLLLQIAHGWNFFSLGGVDPWFYHRFRGWSENPNALSRLCLILTVICFHLFETSNTRRKKILTLICAVPPLTAGILTDSDGFATALAISATIFFAFKFGRSLYNAEGGSSSLIIPALALALPTFLLVASPLAWTIAEGPEPKNTFPSQGHGGPLGEDAKVRLALWVQGLERATNTGMLGLGPGPHLSRPREVREASTTLDLGLTPPAPDFEVHNTFIDLLLQGGLIALLGLIWLGLTAGSNALRAGNHALVALLLGVVVYGMTHFILRSPIVWFVIVSCLAATKISNEQIKAAT